MTDRAWKIYIKASATGKTAGVFVILKADYCGYYSKSANKNCSDIKVKSIENVYECNAKLATNSEIRM